MDRTKPKWTNLTTVVKKLACQLNQPRGTKWEPALVAQQMDHL